MRILIIPYTCNRDIYIPKKNWAGPPAYLVRSSCHISIYSKGENKITLLYTHVRPYKLIIFYVLEGCLTRMVQKNIAL